MVGFWEIAKGNKGKERNKRRTEIAFANLAF